MTALYLLAVAAAVFAFQVGLAVSVYRDRRACRPIRPQPLRLVPDRPAQPAPYDWATSDSGLTGCGLCHDTGRADWTDPLTGSGIVAGVCPCGAIPKVGA